MTTGPPTPKPATAEAPKLLPCPWCGVTPVATTSKFADSMWSEWIDGKWVHQASQNFTTSFKCSTDCILNTAMGLMVFGDIDGRSNRTKEMLHADACLKWNERKLP